jgi:hypothetical protein
MRCGSPASRQRDTSATPPEQRRHSRRADSEGQCAALLCRGAGGRRRDDPPALPSLSLPGHCVGARAHVALHMTKSSPWQQQQSPYPITSLGQWPGPRGGHSRGCTDLPTWLYLYTCRRMNAVVQHGEPPYVRCTLLCYLVVVLCCSTAPESKDHNSRQMGQNQPPAIDCCMPLLACRGAS